MKMHVEMITDIYVDAETLKLTVSSRVEDHDSMAAAHPEEFGGALRYAVTGTANSIFEAFPEPEKPEEESEEPKKRKQPAKKQPARKTAQR